MATPPPAPPPPPGFRPDGVYCYQRRCPYCILDVPHNCGLETAQRVVREVVPELVAGEASEWTVIGQLSAFAAIAERHVGGERARALFEEMRPRPVFDIFSRRPSLPTPPPAKHSRWTGETTRVTTLDLPPPPEPPVDTCSSPQSVAPALVRSGATNAASSLPDLIGTAPESVPMPSFKRTLPPPEEPPFGYFWWQVDKGKGGRKKWRFVDSDLNYHLEDCLFCGMHQTTFTIGEDEYAYDLKAETQTSPLKGHVKRKIRRHGPLDPELWMM